MKLTNKQDHCFLKYDASEEPTASVHV